MKLKMLVLTVCLVAFVSAEATALQQEIRMIAKELKLFPVKGLRRVAVGEPKVADVTVVSERELMLVANDAGTTSLIIWDESGQRSFNIVVIEQDLERVAQRIRELLVSSDIVGLRVKAEQEKAYVIGDVLTQRELDEVNEIIKPFDKAINLVKLKERQPLVEIDVSVLEVSFEDLKKLGMDWSNKLPIKYTESSYIDGKTPKLWKMFEWNRTTIDAWLYLLIEEDKARTLANPKLITLSGKEAKFLVGGEVPYVVQKEELQTTVEWREYGVTLKIAPLVNTKNEIRTKIEAEVSDLDWSNAISHAGYSMPALKKRKVETELFLNEGDIVFLAGLIKNDDSRNIDRIPWLSRVPILGELFKSTDFRDNRTELVISISPHIASEGAYSPSTTSRMLKEEEAMLAAQRGFSSYSAEDSPLTYYSHMIEDIIARNVAYPDASRQAQEEGIVKIDLSLLANGQLEQATILESSGSKMLDQAALTAVKEQAPYPSFPAQLKQKQLRLTVPVVFKSYVNNEQ